MIDLLSVPIVNGKFPTKFIGKDPKVLKDFLVILSGNEQKISTEALRTLSITFGFGTDQSDFLKEWVSFSEVHTFEAFPNYYVFSGTLLQWRSTLVEACSEKRPRDIQVLGNAFFYFFEKANLQIIWRNWIRTGLADGTFVFEEKQ